MADNLAFMFLRIILATHNQNHGFEEAQRHISKPNSPIRI